MPGSLVRVPLRRRSELGVVLRLGTDQSILPSKLKMLYEVVQEYPVLTAELLDLCSLGQSAPVNGPEADARSGDFPAAIRRADEPEETRHVWPAGASPSSLMSYDSDWKANGHLGEAGYCALLMRNYRLYSLVPLFCKRTGISVSACQALLTKAG